MVKAKIRVLHCLKIKFQRRKETQKRNFETATNDTKSPKNLLIPPIKPTRESIRVLLATSKTFAMCLLVDQQRRSCEPIRKQQYDQKYESVGESTLVENAE